jgi:sedoheptulose-bisphosphatase
MKTFQNYLTENNVSEDLTTVLTTITDAFKDITVLIRTADTGAAGTKNIYGEEQLALDVQSDELIQARCKKNPQIGLLASEELPEEMKISEGAFGVAYDPLDGSSLVDVNLAVGTIVGVYDLGASEGDTKTFIGKKGDEQVAAIAAVYGPRTTFTVTLKNVPGVVEFTLHEGGFVVSREKVEVGEGKMFAPGNLRAVGENPQYLKLVEYWMNEQYTLRYSGGMVPDVTQILLKGKGIFSYPPYSKYPSGKLRLLFECAPLGMLMEKAGGAASYGGGRILDLELTELEQRTPIFIGSKEEVERCVSMLG